MAGNILLLGAGCTLGVAVLYSSYGRLSGKSAFPAFIPSIKMKLSSEQPLTHNVRLLRFALPSGIKETGVSPGRPVLATVINSFSKKSFTRPYTPIYSPEDPGYLVLAVKLMHSGGASEAMHHLHEGDLVSFRGPKPGSYVELDNIDSVNMIAAGSGITPVYSSLKYLLKERPETKVNLIYANKTCDDIIFKKEIDELQKTNSGRFTVTYLVEEGAEGNMTAGRITPELLHSHAWKDSEFFICGPPSMAESVKSQVESLTKKRIIVF